MRALIAAPLLSLSLLGGCAQPQYLLSERTDAAPLATTSSLRDVPARYTNHPAAALAPTKVVRLRIDPKFSAEDQAKILAAVLEWNHVLNGSARFDIVAAPAPAPVDWMVAMSPLGVLPSEYDNPQPLALNVRVGKNSGMIIVYANRLKDPTPHRNQDMRGVMVHELGVALGGGNGSTLYTARVQDCVSQSMAESVGSVLDIPTARMNWCEAGTTVATR